MAIPGGAVIVRVERPEPSKGLGSTVAFTPVGKPDTVKVTWPVNPFTVPTPKP